MASGQTAAVSLVADMGTLSLSEDIITKKFTEPKTLPAGSGPADYIL